MLAATLDKCVSYHARGPKNEIDTRKPGHNCDEQPCQRPDCSAVAFLGVKPVHADSGLLVPGGLEPSFESATGNRREGLRRFLV